MSLDITPDELFMTDLYGDTPPFPDVPKTEWRSRIKRAQALMQERDIDLMMLWSRQNNQYFTGFTSIHWELPSLQPMVTLIPAQGEPVIVTGMFFRWTVQGQCYIRDIRSPKGDAHGTSGIRAFPREVAAVCRDMGYGKGSTIALEKGELGHTWIPRPLNDIETLMNELPGVTFADGDQVIWGCRGIKSALEIDRLTTAANMHRVALTAIAEGYRPGMTEQNVSKLFLLAAIEQGADWTIPGHICCTAEKEGMFDVASNWEGMTIGRNDVLSIDMHLRYKGYWADMGRFLQVSPIRDDYRAGLDVMHDAFDAGVEAAKPGARALDVFNAANDVIIKGGIFPNEMYGHGIGLDIHEPPMLVATDETLLEAGMTLAFEPSGLHGGFRKHGCAGLFQYENLLVITEDGCQPIYGLPRSVVEVSHMHD